jgi:hypothetical protein
MGDKKTDGVRDRGASQAEGAAENLCLRQQLVVLRRRQPRPRLRGADRRFWILASQWYSGWRGVLLIVQPQTILRWHREGWRAYWRWRWRRWERGGGRPISAELRALIRRMASENRFWGQRRIQAELTRLGFKVSARTLQSAYASQRLPLWRITVRWWGHGWSAALGAQLLSPSMRRVRNLAVMA